MAQYNPLFAFFTKALLITPLNVVNSNSHQIETFTSFFSSLYTNRLIVQGV